MTSTDQRLIQHPTLASHAPLVHADFDAGDADLIIQASDGVLLKLHRKNLEVTTGAFPGAEFDSQGEVTHLTEPSEVLSILFQFVYPKRHPDLREVDFDKVAAVAEASEKYEVYAAMNICQLRMREFLPGRATEIFNHAVKHGYYGLMDEVIPHIVRRPLIEVLEKLPPARFIAWCRYHNKWDAIFDEALLAVKMLNIKVGLGSMMPHGCGHGICAPCIFSLLEWVAELKAITILSRLQESVRNGVNLTITSDSGATWGARRITLCNMCGQYCKHKVKIAQQIKIDMNDMPSFKTFL